MSKLRCGFLPSDFHPMVLVLGEPDGIVRFANLLRLFAANPHAIDFHKVDFLDVANGTNIRLTTGAEAGMRHIKGNTLVWSLEPWQAEFFADEIDDLAKPGRKSGSAFLEAAVGEVRVKVSVGEYTDDFLKS